MLNDLTELIQVPENTEFEFRAVLPPARTLAQMIAAFANTNGGVIVLGIHVSNGTTSITGLSKDFQANSVTNKAIDLLQPKPEVDFVYDSFEQKRLYVIQIKKSPVEVTLEQKIYIRNGGKVLLKRNEDERRQTSRLPAITALRNNLINFRSFATGSKIKLLEHYTGILNIVEDVSAVLYPATETQPTLNHQGKILMRIMFSSCADNFETYLSDLLYEIYLANPATLKSNQQVSEKEVLDCVDLQDFVIYWSKKKLSKLQRGSVKGFISDNTQIKDLNVLGERQQEAIEKILQIRHLYAHRNGVIDERFLQFYSGQYEINDEHQLSVADMLTHLSFLVEIVDNLDKEAILKYRLATL